MTKRSVIFTAPLAAAAFLLMACSSAPSPDASSSEWQGDIPPCTPAARSPADPCEEGTSTLGRVTASGGPSVGLPSLVILTPEGLHVRHQLTQGKTLHGHIVLRGTYLPGTMRCAATHGVQPPPQEPSHAESSWGEIGTIKCYSDVRVNEYIVGSGPSVLTAIAYVFGYLNYYEIGDYRTLPPDKENETEQEYIERLRLFHLHRLNGGEDNVAGREAMLFLGPSFDTSVEAWEVMRQWRLEQGDDGTVVAVHPQRDDWRDFRPTEYEARRPQLEMELPAFEQAVTAAHEARGAANGGRTRPEAGFPMLVSPTRTSCVRTSARSARMTTRTIRPHGHLLRS